jgi:3-hydroxyacyl-CoA dehydrogenase/3-hydroxy-2-methylbutyryl-CoA dehydrogenase
MFTTERSTMTLRKAVVVTGGSSGLGAATAHRFANAGWTVHVFDIQPKNLPEPTGGSIRFHEVDVCRDESVQAAFEAVGHESDALHSIVHCAGIAAFGPKNPGTLVNRETNTPTDNFSTIERIIRTNLLGTFSILRHGAGLMARNTVPAGRGKGTIVLTSSGAAMDGKAGQSAYSATKAAIAGMTLPLAREFSALGIRVVTIAPGLFDTPILDDTPKLERHVPYPPRVGEPDEFGKLALHITENQYLNAEVIRLDGGSRGGFTSTAPFRL